jgi:histidinol phosphatase-like enzyme
MSEVISEKYITGKTYTLYSNSDSTDGFYIILKNLTDLLLKENVGEQSLLALVQNVSRKRNYLKQQLKDLQDFKTITGIS